MEDQLHIRTFLKIVRDPSKTAYDELPSGRTIGSIANELAISRYKRKIERKRAQTRETRSRKRAKPEDFCSETQVKQDEGSKVTEAIFPEVSCVQEPTIVQVNEVLGKGVTIMQEQTIVQVNEVLINEVPLMHEDQIVHVNEILINEVPRLKETLAIETEVSVPEVLRIEEHKTTV